MRDAPEEQAAHRDMDHGLRDVEAGLVVAYQAAPSHHPAEGPLDDPAARLHLEARLGIDPVYRPPQLAAAGGARFHEERTISMTNSRKAALSISLTRS